MNPGELNHHIIIQIYTTVTDDDGFTTKDWVKFKSPWASKQGLLGRAFYAAAAVQAENDVTYKIRYTKGIKAGMRIVDGVDIYYIKIDPIDRDGKRKELYLVCNVTKPAQNEVG